MRFDDQDFLEIDIALIVEDFRAGKISEPMLYDMLKWRGLTNSEIIVRLYEAKLGGSDEVEVEVEDREAQHHHPRQENECVARKQILAGAKADR